MPAEWLTFLQSHGARLEGEKVLDFGDPEREAAAALNANIVTDLSFLSIIKVNGTDAESFLHGQFTSNIEQLSDGSVQLSAWCNPRGQVIANFIIVRFDDDYFLLLPNEMKDGFIKRLRMFVLRADVALEDCSDSLPCIGFKHKDGDQITGIEIAGRLSTNEQAFQSNGLVMLHVPVNWNRVIMFGPVDLLAAAWPDMVQSYGRTGSHYWQLYDVLDGLPWILQATTETFLPQLLNMDLTQTVSFSKGCFPGQEVIARLQHRGKVKQRLVIANLDSDTNIKPGMNIYQDGREQSVGTIINSAKHPVDGIYALAVLNIDHGTPDQLRLKNDISRFIQITPPPYLMTP